MAAIMVLQAGEKDQKAVSQVKTNTSNKSTKSSKNRPNSLTLSPFDPSELSHKLSAVAIEKGDDSAGSTLSGSQDSLKDDQFKLDTPSPTTAVAKQSPTKSSSKSSKSPQVGSTSRRSSLFGHFSIKGSNYDPKKDDDSTMNPTPYRHVPRTAATQFAKTTTIEPLTDKAVVTKHAKSPGSTSGSMSLQDYNKQYRRTQSMSHGRPYDRNVAPHTVLESTAEVDEDSGQPNNKLLQQTQGTQCFDPAQEMARRMSTGNMRVRPDAQRGVLDVPPPGAGRKDSTNLSVYRAGSVSSIGSNLSPWFHSSAPVSPFNQATHDSRRGSETSGVSVHSRRGSANSQRAAVVDMYHVDWSQGDKSGRRRDSRWSIMRGRIGSVSKQTKERKGESGSVSEESTNSAASTSPKTGILGRFKR
ncbi:hypothetical protein G7Z17_g12331 [Cylindrodendrum hubeiense]|uniref:Uncharacterized protein n=1 Tax=Cylindrodendrum hubeiense TaxID=595255 RepID=A0A9P5GZA1_9HYPO|nr:hypothetical protein G7Z17_g12331 [Cylindrodendrum hubeiense]